MRLALNTFVYEVGRIPVEKTLRSACKFGFEFIDYAAYHSGDPTLMDKAKRGEVVSIFRSAEFSDAPCEY
jgi:hypothetical protein